MIKKVESIFPANDFKVVADSAAEQIEVGLILGYDSEGVLCIYGGGLMEGRQPTGKDWLWIIDSFKNGLLSGDYSID